jgi:5'(3')-deoxyribonucleotidase
MNNLYCDMDGVLVDFLTGAVRKLNEVLEDPTPEFREEAINVAAILGRTYVTSQDLEKYTDTACKEARGLMYRVLEDDTEFWATLPWMDGGRELWEYIRQFNPRILTSPMDRGGKRGSLEGKELWLNENLGLDNIRELIFEHNKYEYALDEDGKPNILIDDFMAKIGPWRKAGGIGIHHPDANVSETIDALKEELKNVRRPN